MNRVCLWRPHIVGFRMGKDHWPCKWLLMYADSLPERGTGVCMAIARNLGITLA
jgi:hypothetical protein